MDKRNIAELIILQCIEDLWDQEEKRGSADFFKGEGFRLCAEIAGIDIYGQYRLLDIVLNIVRSIRDPLIHSEGASAATTWQEQSTPRSGDQTGKMPSSHGLSKKMCMLCNADAL